MKIVSMIFLIIMTMAASPAMADVYMGTASEPTWSPLYPTSMTTMPGKSAGSASNDIIMPTDSAIQGTPPTPQIEQPTQFTATYSPSASSYSQTNYAGGAQVAPQSSVTPYGTLPCQSQQVDMVYGKGPLTPVPCPTAAGVLGVRPVSYRVTTGSLKDNVQRMVKESHWGEVVWNVPNDYRWMGNVTITATSIQGALGQLLAPYPVQAVFYDTNRIVDIEPRRQA
ncbi:MAG: hypothetical protein HKM04_12010 [Legionellales bacterium]|nr:hypothetical protein [Legionellales bacterium]